MSKKSSTSSSVTLRASGEKFSMGLGCAFNGALLMIIGLTPILSIKPVTLAVCNRTPIEPVRVDALAIM